MTIIVGYLDKEGIGHIASDGMGSNGFRSLNTSFQKVNVTKDENLLYGYASRFGYLELKYYNFLPEAKYIKNKDDTYKKELSKVDDEYFFTEFRYKLRERILKMRFKNYGSSEEKSKDNADDVDLIFAHEDKMYIIQNDYEILPLNKGDFVAIGSGGYHAEGALNVLKELQKENLSSKEMVIKAIKSSVESVVTTGCGIYYSNTKDYKVERVN